ncbi:MAG: hypothetical protein WCN85_14625 [Burkholderiales bacterium]
MTLEATLWGSRGYHRTASGDNASEDQRTERVACRSCVSVAGNSTDLFSEVGNLLQNAHKVARGYFAHISLGDLKHCAESGATRPGRDGGCETRLSPSGSRDEVNLLYGAKLLGHLHHRGGTARDVSRSALAEAVGQRSSLGRLGLPRRTASVAARADGSSSTRLKDEGGQHRSDDGGLGFVEDA